jgi:hypothetical protein
MCTTKIPRRMKNNRGAGIFIKVDDLHSGGPQRDPQPNKQSKR